MDIFESCQKINDLLLKKEKTKARNEIIKLLDYHKSKNIQYTPLVNHFIRQVGLYPYLESDSSYWQERFTYEAFKTNIGKGEYLTLHIAQSSVLKKLLEGKNLAVSAPTSFGKSFIIDAFIAIKDPKNVIIIVPTIALTDETRRRLQKKFSSKYKIITTSNVTPGNKNIFIFPQERATHYINKIDSLDMLIIDEFYKASPKFDKERSPSLLKVILKFKKLAKQKYFLAPNISKLDTNIFTDEMEFQEINFNTVYLEKHELYLDINKDQDKKNNALLKILKDTIEKTLIYAGTHSEVDKVSKLLLEDNYSFSANNLLNIFSDWLVANYGNYENWHLPILIKKGTGIHNGRIHRSLSQIQIKLFEEQKNGLINIISTSSIIEGVNTSAKNVILWRAKKGNFNLSYFDYKNIIGRGGRMFQHFIGNIYILEKPPESTEQQLSLEFPEELIGEDFGNEVNQRLTETQQQDIINYKNDMCRILGNDVFLKLQRDNVFESSNWQLIKKIAEEISNNKNSWNGLTYLNSGNVNDWRNILYKVIKLREGKWHTEYNKFVKFVQVISKNWDNSIPELINELINDDITLNQFFELEKVVTYDLSSLLNDINVLQKEILATNYDISPFIAKISHAFLPPIVYRLEEYGLPRMIAKKIQQSKVLDFEKYDLDLHGIIEQFNNIKYDGIVDNVDNLNEFDKYIIKYFFDGI